MGQIKRVKSSDRMVPAERVVECQKRKLERMIEKFQSEPDDTKAHRQWKAIEKRIFGVDYPD